MIAKEKRGIEEQKKNEQLLKEREESKLKITDTGVFFLPQGDTSGNKSGERKTVKSNSGEKADKENEKANIRSKEYIALNQSIEKKVDFLYNYIKDSYNVDTSEFSHAEKSLFVPFYSDMITEKDEKIATVYVPDYKKSEIVYRGFYERGNERTAIIKYKNRMYYLQRGKFLEKTTLSINQIESDSIIFRDNKSGEDIVISK